MEWQAVAIWIRRFRIATELDIAHCQRKWFLSDTKHLIWTLHTLGALIAIGESHDRISEPAFISEITEFAPLTHATANHKRVLWIRRQYQVQQIKRKQTVNQHLCASKHQTIYWTFIESHGTGATVSTNSFIDQNWSRRTHPGQNQKRVENLCEKIRNRKNPEKKGWGLFFASTHHFPIYLQF